MRTKILHFTKWFNRKKFKCEIQMWEVNVWLLPHDLSQCEINQMRKKSRISIESLRYESTFNRHITNKELAIIKAVGQRYKNNYLAVTQ